MPLPFVIDSQQHRLAHTLSEQLAQSVGKPLDIATAYFAISGYRLVKEGLHQVRVFRLLLGAEPHSRAKCGPVSWAGFGPLGRFRQANRPTDSPCFPGRGGPLGRLGRFCTGRETGAERNENMQPSRAGVPGGEKPVRARGSALPYWQPSARVRMARRT